jgi:hypothetical protein
MLHQHLGCIVLPPQSLAVLATSATFMTQFIVRCANLGYIVRRNFVLRTINPMKGST